MKIVTRKRTISARIAAWLMVFCLVLGNTLFGAAPVGLYAASTADAWDGSTAKVPETDESGTFLISNGAELAWFAKAVNEGQTKLHARLTNHIYLNTNATTHRWIIIGNSEEHPFQGYFDGNGKQILGLRVLLSASYKEHYGGLFGVVDGATITNVTVSGTIQNQYKDTVSAGHEFYTACGAIAGYMKKGTISSCVNNAEILMDNTAYYRNTGGIAGISMGSIIRCVNNGTITTNVKSSQYRVGGIVGNLYGTAASAIYCQNNGSVKGYNQIGGIAGSVLCGAYIHDSCNVGALSGSWYVGGIAGKVGGDGTNNAGNSKSVVLKNVYNIGEIKQCDWYAGGIVGEMGYENDADVTSQVAMPEIHNAYSIADVSGYEYSGSIIGHFKSGSMGYVYALSGSASGMVGFVEFSAAILTGPSSHLTADELKDSAMPERLNGNFVVCSSYYEGTYKGYPMLAWQIQSNALSKQVNAGILELRSWLSEENKVIYGEAYSQIETIVDQYTHELGKAVKVSDVNTIMDQARKELNDLVPGTEIDKELVEAKDLAMIRLDEYLDDLLAQNQVTEEGRAELQELMTSYQKKIDEASSKEQVESLLTEGKKALDERLAGFAEDERIELVRQNALEELQDYRIGTYGEPYDTDLSVARNKGKRLIQNAKTAMAVREALDQAKAEIDAIIDKTPTSDAWDGITVVIPKRDENGVYLITSGEELAGFSDLVQTGTEPGANGILCNDINLGGKSFTPIGSMAHPWNGSFEGNGHTIRGLLVNTQVDCAGLFGYMGGAQEQYVQNLTVKGSIERSAGNTKYAGGIVGYTDGRAMKYIINCVSEVQITLGKAGLTSYGGGGIVGVGNYLEIRQCVNKGTVKLESAASNDIGIYHYMGGIAGFISNTTIKACVNLGNVDSLSAAGGIVGSGMNGDNQVLNCYNTGSVDATIYAGGLAACAKAGNNHHFRVECSYSAGIVNAGRSGLNAGLLFGTASRDVAKNLYVLIQNKGTAAIVGSSSGFEANGASVTEEELKSENVLNLLNANGQNYIKDYLNFNHGYPILFWQLTLEEFRYGATGELQNYVKADDYTEENFARVQELLNSGIAAIAVATSMDEINSRLAETKLAISEIESIEDTRLRLLLERRSEAINEISNAVNPEEYRSEEQLMIAKYIEDGVKWLLSAETLEEVEAYRSMALDNLNSLLTDRQLTAQENANAAAGVESYISQIGEVVFAEYVKTSINIARNAYDNLTDEQKALVTNYQVLLDAEAQYEALREQYEVTENDELMAAAVDERIAAIGPVTSDSLPAIKAARAAFDSLTELQKTLVANTAILQAAETEYNALKVREVSAAIAAIGEVTIEKLPEIQHAADLYDALTQEQKAQVTDSQLLFNAKAEYENLMAAANVVEAINKIGAVTLESGNQITTAINAYNRLTAGQQALVTNYNILEEAAAVYDNMYRIDRVIGLIDQIGTVSSGSKSLIDMARAGYNGLSENQRASVYNAQVLFNAEAAYSALYAPTSGGAGSNIFRPSTPSSSIRDLYQTGNGGNSDSTSSGNTSGNTSGGSSDGSSGGISGGNLIDEKPIEDDASEDKITDKESALDGLVYEAQAENGELDGQTETLLPKEEQTITELLESDKASDRRFGILKLLAAIAGVLLILQILSDILFRKSKKKRKETLLHY